ncbi:hypothetical protein P3G55_10190 [Leptospira sp. 96542]|nr:hypothetical protein [Leptospira sp. 96542]
MFGKDIYWYGVQTISLLETGQLHSPDRSPIFHIVFLVFRLFGISDESLLVFQVLTVVWLSFCLFFARYLIVSSWEDCNFFPSVMLVVLGFLYPKQAWAIGFLILAIGFYLSNRIHKDKWKWILVGFSFLFATWFHTLVGLLGLGVWVLYRLPRKFDILWFLALVVIPNLWPTSINDRYVFDTEIFPIRAAYAMVGIGILWDWFYLVFGKNIFQPFIPIRTVFALFGLLLVIPIFHFSDIQFRILISILILNEIFFLKNTKQFLVTSLSFALWTLTLSQEPNLFRYPYEEMWNPGEKAASIDNNGLLVAHHGFCEYYHFQFRKDCLSWEPDDKAVSELPHNTKIYRLVYGIRMENLRASKDNEKPIFSFIEPMGEYQLVLEEDWKRYIFVLENKKSKLLPIAKSWKNPYRKRPGFIQRKQKYGI